MTKEILECAKGGHADVQVSVTQAPVHDANAVDDGTDQISAIIHDRESSLSFAASMRKAACALFLVCLDEAGDDVKKIQELSAELNLFLDKQQ